MNLNDLRVKQQAIMREYDLATRRHREPKFPQLEGHSVVGSIHDCNRLHFERVLKAYWDKLYVGWNPFKNEGKGCWEIWQQPSKKTPILHVGDEHNPFDLKIYTLEYMPNDLEHWVADLDYLSYDYIDKLRAMDQWDNKFLVKDHDKAHDEHFEKLEREEDDNLRQIIRENKQVFRDLLDYTQSGYNPLDFFHIKK